MSFAFLAGFQLSLGLIAAIGAQNAFVLRQGLRREHVLAVCLFCAASDAALITAGVAGFGTLSRTLPAAGEVLRWGGVAFLLWYGARAFRAAWRGGGALHAAGGGAARLPGVLAALALITWANPHVWLDTVVLIGSVSARYPGQSASFGAGAALASFVFFFALGYGARLLAPLFARPRAWQVLDAAVGVIMWTIALRLALG
ncbi:LysE/ArgO family amino acid transporter [Albidovulum sp.]|jgi:L-lysine exporter family protein LysE/ArgO|uniref:LysE/ArgO family amino acid transporter n=2 Tax=Albidovulum sp. TaxID=1872424 RepID=UPI003054FD62